MKLFLFALTFLMTVSAGATEFKLAVIKSEFDNDTTDFFVETNSADEISSIRYVITTPSGSIFEDTTIPAETVLQDGAVLAARNGRDVLKLMVDEGFNIKTGGSVRLTYLNNGISNTWRFIPLKFSKSGVGFKLSDAEGTAINNMYVYVNKKPIIGVVGIKTIETWFE